MTAQELKNSILQLAVKGKLVQQNPDDEPVSELLKRIESEKEKALKSGLIKKDKKLLEITADDYPHEIPNTWKWLRLGNLCQLLDGEKINDKRLPYLEAKYLRGKIEATILDNGKFVKKHTRLILVDGENSGEVFFATEDGYMGSTFKVLYIPNSIYVPYVLNFLLLKKDLFRNKKTGAAIPHLNKELFFNLLIPIPPYKEQERIVAKIEELLPYVEEYDKVEERLLELNDEFPDKLRKSILQQAIQGRLTERHPDDKPACEILNRIREEKAKLIAEKKIKKGKTLSPIMDDEKLFDIPDTWEWCRIGDIFVTSSGTTPSRSNSKYYENGVYNWVRTTDLNNSVLCSCEIKVSDIAFNECRLSIIPRNSVCIAMYGGAGTIGKNALVDFDTTINQSVCAIHPNELIDMKYVQIYMHFYRPFWMLEASGARQDPNINQIIIKNALIAIPPLAEQKRIVSRVEELLAVCDKLK